MKLLNLAPETVWSVYYCQVGYEVSNPEVQNQLDFINNKHSKHFQVQDSNASHGMFENDFSSGADGDISGGNCCGQMSEDELTHVPADQRRLRKRCDDGKPSHII